MRTETRVIYQFKELSDEAKENALNNYRKQQEGCDFEWLTSDAMSTIKGGLDAFNATLDDWSIDFQNSNQSSFKIGRPEQPDDDITGVRLRTYLINNFYGVFYETKPYGEYKKRDNGSWGYQRRSRVIFRESDCPFTGMCYDCSFLDGFRKFLKSPDNSTFKELLEDAVYRVIRDVESEIECYFTDEGMQSEIEGNELEFDEEGNRI